MTHPITKLQYLLLTACIAIFISCTPTSSSTITDEVGAEETEPTIAFTQTPLPTATTIPPTATATPKPTLALPTATLTPTKFEGHDAINTRDIQLRTGAGPNHTRIGLLQANTPLNLQARNGDWFLVDTDTLLSGWLPLTAIEFRPNFDPSTLPILNSQPPLTELLQTYPAVTYNETDLFTGPSLAYGVYGNGIPANTPLNIVGRDSIGLMLEVNDNFGPSSWVLASSLRFSPTFNIFDLPVTAQNEFQADAKFVYDWSTHIYEYGGQTHDMRHTSQMAEIGMTWVKVQYKFHENSQPRDIIGLVEQAHERGFKLLLATTGQPYPDKIEFERYVEFIGGVAALPTPPDAIEIWNEMNIDFEWPLGEIDPVSYVERLLKPSYEVIKAANENIMVISGAPAPTGFNDGIHAWADDRYMAGMFEAGAIDYLDCIGIHYNSGATSPGAWTGHPAGGFYGWYFQPSLQTVDRLSGHTRPVCITEIGFLTNWDLDNNLPQNFWWARGTSVEEHANWLAEAHRMSRDSGLIRLFIVFSADIYHWDGRDPQTGYTMFRPNGSCPACEAFKGTVFDEK
ncbi:MAG: hypothetical protein AAGD96_07370 [Chloroflexota bacterium]